MVTTENRYEPRLAYRWPIWFGEDIARMIHAGLMLNVSSTGIAFTIQAADRSLVQAGRGIAIRFSLPRFDGQDPGATVGVTRTGRVRWINAIAGGYKIGLQFDTPLSLKPAEQAAATPICTDARE
ncbi:MAG TPA: PilZ domain-containing protein [Sedimentisphaerales bacterium]|nr:PilZ domain-containing protein [Sedimentisphaerales bacterium]HNU29803.1 PilZ domain-containing protein [Sedimentisphaerales bacterium]